MTGLSWAALPDLPSYPNGDEAACHTADGRCQAWSVG